MSQATENSITQLANASADTINLINEWAKSAGDKITEQAPLVVQEIIHYRMTMDLLWTLVCIFAVITALINIKKLVTFCQSVEDEYGEMYDVGPSVKSVSYIVASLFSILVALGTFPMVNDLIKVVLAPRLYILDYMLNYLQH